MAAHSSSSSPALRSAPRKLGTPPNEVSYRALGPRAGESERLLFAELFFDSAVRFFRCEVF